MWGWIAAIVWFLLVIGTAGDNIGWIILLTITPYVIGRAQRGGEKGAVVAASLIGIPVYLFGLYQIIMNIWGDGSSAWNQITSVLVLIVLLPVTVVIGIALYLKGADVV